MGALLRTHRPGPSKDLTEQHCSCTKRGLQSCLRCRDELSEHLETPYVT